MEMTWRVKMSKSNPWKEIITPVDTSLSARIADPTHPLEFYWAKDRYGRYLFVLHASEDLVLSRNIPEPSGVRVELGFLDEEKKDQMRLILVDEENYDIFYSLCRDLMAATRNISDEQAAVSVIITRLERWQKFLRNAGKKIDERQIRGLFGELWFIKKELIPLWGAHRAIGFWSGPRGDIHDFGIGTVNIEVKTRPSTTRANITVSSPEQLWNEGGILFLYVLIVAKAKGSEKEALSLRALVHSIRKELATLPEAEEMFESLLMESGFIDIEEFERPLFLPGSVQLYEVKEGFPRLDPASVPDGIEHIRFDLDLTKCREYMADKDLLRQALKDER